MEETRPLRSLLAAIPVCALAFGLSACAGAPKPLPPAPVAQVFADPDDSLLDAAVQDYLVKSKGPRFSHYQYTRIDLDGDGRRDALVMFTEPYSYWCDPNGCSLSVFRAANDGFAPVSEIFPVRGPLYVGDARSGGWKDLIVHIDGLPYADAKDVALRFDGTSYPRNPFFQPSIAFADAHPGSGYFP